MHKNIILAQFTDSDKWTCINDDVMGGISTSNFQVEKGNIGVFRGDLSLENNGGFASCRKHLNMTEEISSFKLKVKGDGKIYKFRVRNQQGTIFQKSFTTKEHWEEIRLYFQDFQAVYRGRILDIETPKVIIPSSIGFLISDKQESTFELQIDWIKGYTTEK